MCGICGIYNFRGDTVSDFDIKTMNQQMVHRGPDDEGVMTRGRLGLGMRRLSIIDLAGGHQPIYNEDKTIAVVLNGEIYNYCELMRELESKGHKFDSHSDTEVLVHLYEERGIDMLDYLNGMFVFALYDQSRDEFYLVRDRLGIKQVYYYLNDNKIAFASDLRSLLALPEVKRQPHWPALADYLMLSFIPAPCTAFADIFCLPTATWLRIDQKGTTLKKYWNLANYTKTNSAMTEGELLEQFSSLLYDSVQLELRSDVPLGMFLSGGLDSATITSLAASMVPQPIRTFTVSFDADEFSEAAAAREIAEYCHTQHTELKVTYQDIIRDLPFVVWHLTQPIADSAILPSYHVSKLASPEVKVLLNGAGGDELLAGYLRHHQPLFQYQALKLIPPIFIASANILSLNFKNKNLLGKLHDYCRTKNFFLAESTVFSDAIIQKLSAKLPPRLSTISRLYHIYSDKQQEYINQLCALDCQIYLPDDILFLLDKTTMAVSIEGRVPWLDHRLVEFMQQVPVKFKINQGVRKSFLRKMMQRRLPASILENRRKQGFAGPIESWKEKGLFIVCRNLLLSAEAKKRDFWNEKFVKEIFTHSKNLTGQQVWSLLILELWMRIFLDGNPLEVPKMNLLDI